MRQQGVIEITQILVLTLPPTSWIMLRNYKLLQSVFFIFNIVIMGPVLHSMQKQFVNCKMLSIYYDYALQLFVWNLYKLVLSYLKSEMLKIDSILYSSASLKTPATSLDKVWTHIYILKDARRFYPKIRLLAEWIIFKRSLRTSRCQKSSKKHPLSFPFIKEISLCKPTSLSLPGRKQLLSLEKM